MKESRTRLAQEIRKALDDMESSRRDKIEQAKQSTLAETKKLYERRYIDDPDAASRVDESEYGALIQQVRYPNGRSTTSSTSLVGLQQPRRLKARARPKMSHQRSSSHELRGMQTMTRCAANQIADTRRRTSATVWTPS